jgi:hypothetical protein
MRYTRMTGLGDTSVQLDSSDILNLGNNLRSAQASLTTLFQQMQQDPALAAAIGRDLTAQQQTLGDLISKYVYIYTAVFGQAPAGLTGLGNPILIAGALAVLLAAIIAGYEAWKARQDTLEQQAQAAIIAEQNRGSIISMAQQKMDQANQLAAAGDTTGAADAQNEANLLLNQAGVPGTGTAPPPPGSQTFAAWMQANWLTVALIGGAIYLTPKILDR